VPLVSWADNARELIIAKKSRAVPDTICRDFVITGFGTPDTESYCKAVISTIQAKLATSGPDIIQGTTTISGKRLPVSNVKPAVKQASTER
jgi:hypothetical protein